MTESNEASQAGRLEGIWIKRARRGLMDPLTEADLVAGSGIDGNLETRGRRQVTILSRERWDDFMRQLGGDVDPSARRANFLVTGVDLADTRDRVLRIGPVRVRILGETRPCERMDEALPGLRELMRDRWGGGAYGEVLDSGAVKIGDGVGWVTD